MTTSQITSTIAGNITVATGGNYSDPLTIADTGAVAGTVSVQNGETIVNYGQINTDINVNGMSFAAGGAVTNEAGGTISGGGASVSGAGILTAGGQPTTVDNFGVVTGDRGVSFLSTDGAITNEMGGAIVGIDFGVLWSGAAGTVINDGSIAATGATYGDGVDLKAGGAVTNDGSGQITGAITGVSMDSAAGTVTNAGTIIGTLNFGVVMGAGGSIGNTGTIGGGLDGVLVQGAAGTVDNCGTIYASQALASGASVAVELDAGGSVTNEEGGQILGVTKGIYLKDGGSVTNLATGTIGASQVGIAVGGAAGTIDNSGAVTASSASGVGIDLTTGGGTIVNETGGSISGSFIGINSDADMTLTNASGATISSYKYAVNVFAGHGTIDNSGTIETGTYVNAQAIYLNNGGTVTNHSGGLIAGNHDGVFVLGGNATVGNAGDISGQDRFGINLGGGGLVSNAATGSIVGGTIGAGITGDTGTVINQGYIAGTGDHSIGVELDAGGAVSNLGTGAISGSYAGVYFMNGGTVANAASATISGGTYGVYLNGAAGTVDNAGTIVGGDLSVDFTYAGDNRLIIHAGAVFDGDVHANASGTNTLELASSAAGGAITGLGDKYLHFQTVTIDSGASWDIGGTEAGLSASSIAGFHAGDRLDITDLSFNAADTATESGDVLTIRDGSGTVLDTFNLPGVFAGHSFNLLSDGHGGSFVEEDGVACYCRGTGILTDRGEVPVEDLRIGDLVITAAGVARPIRWIGMRAYDGRFVAGRKDLLPITIAAGALADNVPKRDLSVSPLHAMFIDDLLIPARALVDGNAITQADTVTAVEYFHIELETHDVIVAEGALSETFVEDGSRGMFRNADEFTQLYPGAGGKPVEYCAPIVEDGEELEIVRRRIAARHALLAGEGRVAA